MANVNWVPPDISGACAESVAPLTQCSQTGFMFLALVARLFGGSVDNSVQFPKVNPYAQNYKFGYESEVSSVYSEKRQPEDDITGSDIQNQLGPAVDTEVKTETTLVGLGPAIHQTVEAIKHQNNEHHVHRYPGVDGYSESAFYTGPDFEFESDTFAHPIAKYYFSGLRNFGNRRSYADTDTADSETVAEKNKKSEKKRKKRHAKEIYDFIIVGAGSAGCVIANRLSEVKKWKHSWAQVEKSFAALMVLPVIKTLHDKQTVHLMISDCIAHGHTQQLESRVCIVSMGNRIEQVLLIEAGPEEPDVTSVPSLAPTLGRSSIDWMYRTQPEELTCRAQLGQTCAWLSGRVMGGSSSINYLVYMRGNKKDYNDWAALGNEGWSYRDVLPYFKKSENNRDIEGKDKRFHGVGGLLNVERFANIDKNIPMLISAFNESGLPLVDFNGDMQIGAMTTQTTTKDGKRMSTNKAFIRPIINKRNNLHVRTNAQVIKVEIDHKTLKAYGIKYVKNGVLRKAYSRKEIIISAGALNSPKILLLSGIGPKEHLKSLGIPLYKDLKVGYNLQDHATVDAFLMKLSNKTSTQIKSGKILKEVLKYSKLKYRDGLLSATGPLQITAFIRTKFAEDDVTVPDIQFHFDGRNGNDFYLNPTTYLASNIFPLAYYDAINVRPILLSPKSRGYLTLNRTNPIFGQPLIYPNFFTEKRDIDTLIEALKYAIKLENTKAFKMNQVEFIKVPVKACDNYKWGSYEYFFCIFTRYTATIFHPAGTCKMGPRGDKYAVVDSRLRIYGISNLRVADASIMPNIVRGNTNAPVIMIGEKVSDMIKNDWNF